MLASSAKTNLILLLAEIFKTCRKSIEVFRSRRIKSVMLLSQLKSKSFLCASQEVL